MPIVVPVGTGTTVGTGVTTYSGLVASVQSWLNRSDLDIRVPNFITLLEAELNRELRTPEMEEIADLAIVSGEVALPTDFLEVRSFTIDTSPRTELIQAPLAQIESYYESDPTGLPAYYAITDGVFKLGPEPADGFTARLAYYEKITALSSSNETNWLIVSHPDIYLWGSLSMAEAFLWNDERVALWRSAFDAALDSLKRAGRRKRHGGALSTRIPSAA